MVVNIIQVDDCENDFKTKIRIINKEKYLAHRQKCPCARYFFAVKQKFLTKSVKTLKKPNWFAMLFMYAYK